MQPRPQQQDVRHKQREPLRTGEESQGDEADCLHNGQVISAQGRRITINEKILTRPAAVASQ